jgi:hypothetical protein
MGATFRIMGATYTFMGATLRINALLFACYESPQGDNEAMRTVAPMFVGASG